MPQRVLFLFRRDLRLHDNTGLIAAAQHGEVIPVFIFDTRQRNHDYFSAHAFSFLLESLEDLNRQLQEYGSGLVIREGLPDELLAQLCKEFNASSVVVNRDYTPFSKTRDGKIEAALKAHGIAWHAQSDALLHEPETVKKQDGTPYTVFTPFWRQASSIPIPKPVAFKGSFYKNNPEPIPAHLRKLAKAPSLRGGTTEGLKLLQQACTFKDYGEQRDMLALDATSHLSAHFKFGTVSVRHAYHELAEHLGESSPIVRQLFWRDFFNHIAFHFPYVFGHSFQKKYDKIQWAKNDRYSTAWKEGRTGFPIVDAGMRELNETGYMHNRARMICASFLVKDLHLDWREGEKYFAQQLTDYDPCVNNGSWQWAASTGCDAQPYFRIFNPWLQQQKFDPDCEYIKRWVPELQHLSPKAIHAMEKQHPLGLQNYPRPIVDHRVQSEQAKAMFAGVR
jgi:deoxyribodipyrimidine photo-lyase